MKEIKVDEKSLVARIREENYCPECGLFLWDRLQAFYSARGRIYHAKCGLKNRLEK